VGKSYFKELRQLVTTFDTAMAIDIGALRTALMSACTMPVYAVGSGGSLSAAHLVAHFHQRLARQFAEATTPLQVTDLPIPRDVCVWFLSAGGRNADINDAFKETVVREPQRLVVTCAKTGSPLARQARQYWYTNVFDFDLPSGRDGFLATNSLLAFATIVARAYHQVFLPGDALPKSITELLQGSGSLDARVADLREACAPLWNREYLVALFGPATQPAAVDLESKFTEAALGPVLLADYRNFAHGRHHWLAKRGETAAVLALSVGHERPLAERTLALLPHDVPKIHLDFSGRGMFGPVAALAATLYIVALAGEARAVDPGSPSVPAFGRQIYHLRGLRTTRKQEILEVAVRRKLCHTRCAIQERPNDFRDHCRKFIRRLETTQFAAIALDYDGTLCAPEQRFSNISSDVAMELARLARAGFPVGIATGRGKSVRQSLRQSLSRSLWRQLVVGYYNGAERLSLDEEQLPGSANSPCRDLEPLVHVLSHNNRYLGLYSVTVRKYQVTVEPSPGVSLNAVWMMVNTLIQECKSTTVRVVVSDHSIDILAPGVSKINIMQSFQTIFGVHANSPILCIGDQGAWPGNDHELLQTPYSLSVDKPSLDPESCWNLAPPGYRGVQAALFYLRCIQVARGKATFKLRNLKGAAQ